MARDFYSTYGTEPNMRGEMNSFLDGDYPEITKKTVAALRKMRVPEEECPCVDAVTHEPDKDNVWCPFCQGEGRYWDETFIDVGGPMYGTATEPTKTTDTQREMPLTEKKRYCPPRPRNWSSPSINSLPSAPAFRMSSPPPP